MHPPALRAKARSLLGQGCTVAETARATKLPYRTVSDWARLRLVSDEPTNRNRAGRCPRCASPSRTPDDPFAYCYLLGQYLGDGHLTTTTRAEVLRIACADTYPRIMEETRQACLATLAKKVQFVQNPGCTTVQSYSTHWTCLFPQHGPGMKHTRKIELADWQEDLVAGHPRPFLRGLIHADGCRSLNRVTVRGKDYEYPRYFFGNESTDILQLCGEALDRVGAQWRYNRRNSISVAKRASVALLDEFIGPKE